MRGRDDDKGREPVSKNHARRFNIASPADKPAATCDRCGATPVRGRGMCSYHYAKWRTAKHAAGEFVSLVVPADTTQQHLAALRAAGVGLPRIAELSGLPRLTVAHLPDAGRRMVARSTEAALLAIPLPTTPFDALLAAGAKVPILGSRRRLRALCRAGYAQNDILWRLGANPGGCGLSKIYSGPQPYITARRARAIAALFDELQLIPGPSRRAMLDAKRKGWPHPLEWDEDTIDDPDAQPCPPPVPPVRIATGIAIPADFADIVAEHRSLGRTDADIAERLGIKLDTLQSRMRRLAS